MTYLKTTNALTAAHGHSPLHIRTKENFDRGWVIYLEITADAFLRARQFYRDFTGSDSAAQQLEFEQDVMTLAALPENNPRLGQAPAHFGFDLSLAREISGATKKPFPFVYYATLNRVDFGWKPCHVTYILANNFYGFMEPDARNPTKSLSQPVVFRSSKAVEMSGMISEMNFQPNFSFYNLSVDNSSDPCHAFLRFDNFMLDENGVAISRNPENPANPAWDYCMDINIRIPAARFAALDLAWTGANPAPDAALMIVFDPPNTNGGGMGAEP